MPAVFCPKCRAVARTPDDPAAGNANCPGCGTLLPVRRPRLPFDSEVIEFGIDPGLPLSEQPTDRIRRPAPRPG